VGRQVSFTSSCSEAGGRGTLPASLCSPGAFPPLPCGCGRDQAQSRAASGRRRASLRGAGRAAFSMTPPPPKRRAAAGKRARLPGLYRHACAGAGATLLSCMPRMPRQPAMPDQPPAPPPPDDAKPDLSELDLWGAFAASWEPVEPAEPPSPKERDRRFPPIRRVGTPDAPHQPRRPRQRPGLLSALQPRRAAQPRCADPGGTRRHSAAGTDAAVRSVPKVRA
jgi:hypothetical protein